MDKSYYEGVSMPAQPLGSNFAETSFIPTPWDNRNTNIWGDDSNQQLSKSLNTIEQRIKAIESRLDAASIEALCQDGIVTVTLNL
jgi:hypothetical protein